MESEGDAAGEASDGAMDLDAELAAELLQHYLGAAGERVAALEAALTAVRAAPADGAALDALQRVLHKTAGSAGTYGFRALTRSARALEKMVVSAQAAPPAPAALFEAVASFHRQMIDEFAAARARSGTAAPPSFLEAPSPAAPPAARGLSPVRERLVVAVLPCGTDDDACAAAAGAALACAGAHLLGMGTNAAAARGYREASSEGLVLWLVEGARSAASPDVDLPLCAPTLEARCALAVAAADGAIVLGGGGGEALALCGFFLREAKPVVAILSSGGAAALLAGRELGGRRVFTGETAEDAVAELLTLLAVTVAAR